MLGKARILSEKRPWWLQKCLEIFTNTNTNIPREELYPIARTDCVPNLQEIFLHTEARSWYLVEYQLVSYIIGGMKSANQKFNSSRNIKSEVIKKKL